MTIFVPRPKTNFQFPNLLDTNTTFIIGGVRLGQLYQVIQGYLDEPTSSLDVQMFRPLKAKWNLKEHQTNHQIGPANLRLCVYNCKRLFAVEVHMRKGDAQVAFHLFHELRSRCILIPNAVEFSADMTPVTPTKDQVARWTYTPPTSVIMPSQEDADVIFRYLFIQSYETVLAGVSMCASALLEDPDGMGILIGQNSHFRRRLFELLGNQWDCVEIKRCAAIALKVLTPRIQQSDLKGQGLSHPFHQLILRQNQPYDLETIRTCEEILHMMSQ
jgi:hypothetical protein